MGYQIYVLTLIQILLLHISFTIAQPTFTCEDCTGNATNAYRKNVDKIFTRISTNIESDNSGFYNLSEGEPPNKVYAVASCRGDLSPADCRSSINNAISKFRQICLTNNASIGYYDSNCMLRYTYIPIFAVYEFAPNCTWGTIIQVQESYKEKYKEKVSDLFDELINKTIAGNSPRKFASGVVDVSVSLKAYAITQCTPDLSTSDCLACLKRSTGFLISYPNSGMSYSLPSCIAEFQNYEFFKGAGNNSASSILVPSSSSHSRKVPGKNTYIICGIVFALLILASFVYFFSRKRQVEEGYNEEIRCLDYMEFDYDSIVATTNNFSISKRLGKGNSDSIFKGMLPSGQEVAVKRLEKYGKDVKLKFNNEVHLLTNLQHINVVKLLGFSIQDKQRLLIYEFLCNESLDLFLSDSTKRENLEWEARYNIIKGIARGLHYLHEDSQLRVIHRDLKASNILISAHMKPKISNFTKASHIHVDQTRRGDNSAIKGTYGYMPPEYMEHGHFSVQSDVFSFGVILLEILCGKAVVFLKGKNEADLLSYAWHNWFEGRALDAIDPILPKIKSHTTFILRCFKIALLCVQEDATRRPTMAAIIFMFDNDTVLVEEPSKPAFYKNKK